jgi:hypothetical protein
MTFPSRPEYERLVYSLPHDHPEISHSTLRLYSTSALTAIVEGSVLFHSGLELRIVEALDFKAGQIRHYSYAVFRGEEKVRWYDSQPHPENPDLSSTFPHHYHTPPDIKHNRHAAPGISFESPNLPTLIADCLALGADLESSAASGKESQP